MREAPKSPPKAPSPCALAEELGEAIRGGTLIVGAGQFSPWPEHARVGVLRVDGEPLLIWDGFLPEAEIPALREALAARARVWPGELHMMYATPWKWAWTVPPAPFRLIGREGLACAVEGGVVRVGGRSMEASAITLVMGWVSDDAFRRGVDLVLRSGERLTVAEDTELSAAIDPTYDGIDLMFDAAWVPALGRALAKGLGVAYEATASGIS